MKNKIYLLLFLGFFIFFSSSNVNAEAGADVGGNYYCHNGPTLLKTGNNTWSTGDPFPNLMKNYINCPDGWTNVRITIPKSAYISLFQGSAPFSWYFKTSGNMEKWSVYDLSSGYQKRMLNGADYINGFNTTGDTVDFDIFNNGYPQSSFWLYMPNMAELDSAGVASFESSLNSNNISNNLDSSKNDILNNNNSNATTIIDNQNNSTNSILNNQNNSTNKILDNQNNSTNSILNNQNNSTNKILDNQNSNSQNEIDNANKNKQEMIDNANKNNKEMIDNNNQLIKGNCRIQPGKNLFNTVNFAKQNLYGVSTSFSDSSVILNGTSTGAGSMYSSTNSKIILEQGTYTISYLKAGGSVERDNNVDLAFYFNSSTNSYAGFSVSSFLKKDIVSITFTLQEKTELYFNGFVNGAGYKFNDLKINIQIEKNPKFTSFSDYEEVEVCEGGLNGSVDNVKDSVDNLNDSINNSNIDSSSANSFFSNFKDNDYGLSSVVTAPLQFIKNLNNSVCTPLKLDVPFVKDSILELPCMTTIYKKNFNSFFTIYQTITTGFIAYWISVKIFALVKGFKDPENDKLEVMDL